MDKKWVVMAKSGDFRQIGKSIGTDPVVARLLRNRGLSPEGMVNFLNPDTNKSPNSHLLKDVDRASIFMLAQIEQKSPIRIIGDYDIDGINATYILYRALKNMGADVDYDIPDRVKDGYGINRRLIDKAAAGKKVIVTCDNGISAYEEIRYAKEDLNLSVVVTDHHDVPYETDREGERKEILPPADFVIDPKREGDSYPFKEICGAMVAFKYMQVLYETSGEDKTDLDDLIQFVAFATVGDVMPLISENRAFVREGLSRMNETSHVGLKALIEANELEEISAYHLGFVLGPCVNAAGRLDSALKAMELFTCTDENEAKAKAKELVTLNERRKELTAEGVERAAEEIAAGGHADDHVYVIFLPDLNESVAGIVAGRLKERYDRPVFVITGEGDEVKGSGRSIEAYSMYDELNGVKELFAKFGGHPMAAGFSLPKENVSVLRQRLNENDGLTEDDMTPRKVLDMVMPIGYVSEELIRELSVLEPYGMGNPKPLFAENKATLTYAMKMGRDKNFLKLSLTGEDGRPVEAVYFNDADDFLDAYRERFGKEEEQNLLSGKGSGKVSFSYYPNLNEYNGKKTIQIVIDEFLI